jgi:hypothetical protein
MKNEELAKESGMVEVLCLFILPSAFLIFHWPCDAGCCYSFSGAED